MMAKRAYTYAYEEGRLSRAAEYAITVCEGEVIAARSLINSIQYTYDADGDLKKKTIMPTGGTRQDIWYERPEEGDVVTKFTVGSKTVLSHSKTDAFGRKVFDELQLATGTVSRQFTYRAGEITDEHKTAEKIKSTATTQLVKEIVLSDGRTLSYGYDAEERITKVTDSVYGTTEYTYDALGQLLTETVDGTVVNVMTYDGYGNIVLKNGKQYCYDEVWRDKLTCCDGQVIEYDAQGNPISYLGHTLTWEKGRQLKTFDNIQYTYNANGIRTSKNVNGVLHTYTLDGTKILRETWSGNTLVPLYDNEESVCGIVYNKTPYYFLKNLQGDVIAIVDKDGATVAGYSYDAWGVCTVIGDISDCRIATINPFRYRGYYYDEEIGMYYLQSRYYNPVIGRFLNVDTSDSLQNVNKVLENNLFAYCQNDPVNESDYTGSLLTSLIKKILTGVFKGFIGLLGSDFITFLYKVLLVDSKTKFTMSSGSEYLKSIASAVVSELIDIFGGAKFIVQVFMIVGSYFTKIVNGRMDSTDWITLVIKLAMLVLKTVLRERLNKQKKKELDLLKKFRKKKSKNLKLKNQRRQVKLNFEKKGFKVDITFDITEYVLENFLNILALI